ncbi:OLC1v1001853C1 [Oldenlandia corymbosa var. corymbosa]|nr:OLC1v1001853C1 [Oldenlandia corymbosa var. corymbosa]
MDKNGPGKEVSEDATRESLIALSYTAPDKEAANSNEKGIKENNLGAGHADGDDQYRSKLISISYQSPDPKALPVHPGDGKA